MRPTWEQFFEAIYFHGDLQPGNIMLLRKNRLALIDFGSIGSLDASTFRLFIDRLKALFTFEYSKAADFALLNTPDVPEEFRL